MVVAANDNLTEDDVKKFNNLWPKGWVDEAKNEGILDKDIDPNKDLTREESFKAFYNMLEKKV